jgi:hypothetical protein
LRAAVVKLKISRESISHDFERWDAAAVLVDGKKVLAAAVLHLSGASWRNWQRAATFVIAQLIIYLLCSLCTHHQQWPNETRSHPTKVSDMSF